MAYLKGIDVSHWQGTEPSHAGLSFLFARATFGTAKDDKYEFHKANAIRDGLVFGAYHFGNPSQTVSAQLRAFLAATKGVSLCVLDIEANDMSLANAKVFIGGARAAGKVMGVYHSLSGYPWSLGQDFDWLAAWGYSSVPGPWEFWQYRGSPLDLDYFRGTEADLHELAQLPLAPDTSAPAPTTGADDSMKLTSVTDASGTATMKADGPVWNVNTGVAVTALAGSTRRVVGKCQYDAGVPSATTSPGYMIASNASDGELLVVHQSGVTFTPAPVPVTDCTAAVKAATDPLKATIAADVVAMKLARADISSKNDAITALQTQLATATSAVKVASAAGAAAEQARIRALLGL